MREGAQNLEFWTQITSKFSHFFEEIEPEYFSFRGNGAVVTKPAQKTTLGERAWHRHSRCAHWHERCPFSRFRTPDRRPIRQEGPTLLWSLQRSRKKNSSDHPVLGRSGTCNLCGFSSSGIYVKHSSTSRIKTQFLFSSQNIQKILGLAPSRAATKQAGGFLGPPPPSGKFSWNQEEPCTSCLFFFFFKMFKSDCQLLCSKSHREC